jgi:hypothetical protein
VADAGRFVQRLVRGRGWSYARLPLDGLRSVVFEHPSPTHCAASGNVWVDHPCADGRHTRCITHEAVRQLRAADAHDSLYDWKRFYFLDQVCLRLSKKHHDEQTCGVN